MSQRVTRILLSKYVTIPVGAVLIYTLVGFFLTPALVRWYVPKIFKESANHQAEIGKVQINPYLLTFEAHEFSLSDAEGSPVAGFKRLFLDVEIVSLYRWALVIRAFEIDEPNIHVAIEPDGSLNLAKLAPPPENPKPSESKPPPVFLQDIGITGGRIVFVDRRQSEPATIDIEGLDLYLRDLSTLEDQNGTYCLSASTAAGEKFDWAGDISLTPLRSSGRISLSGLQVSSLWKFAKDMLNLDPPEGVLEVGTNYRFDIGSGKPDLVLDDIRIDLADLSLRLSDTQQPLLKLAGIKLEGGRLDLAARELDAGNVTISGGAVNLMTDPGGRMNAQQLVRKQTEAEKEKVVEHEPGNDSAPGPSESAVWKISLGEARIEDLALGFKDLSRHAPMEAMLNSFGMRLKVLAELGAEGMKIILEDISSQLKGLHLKVPRDGPEPATVTADIADLVLSCKAAMESGSSGTKVSVENLATEVKKVQFLSQENIEPLFQTERLVLEGGSFDLAAHSFTIARIGLMDGGIQVVRDREGQINWLRLAGSKNESSPAPAAEPAKPEKPSWNFLLKQIEILNFRTSVSDLAAQADRPLLDLENLNVRLENIDGRSPIGFDMAFQIKGGGDITLRGAADPIKPSVESNVRVKALDLSPIQPYLEPFVTLTLESAKLSTEGVFRFGVPNAGSKIAYEGNFSIEDLKVLEPASGETFLGWQSFKMPRLKLTLEPDGLDVPELKLTKPAGKLMIAEDKSINVTKVLKERSGQGASAPAPPDRKRAGDAFPFRIGSVRIENGKLLFADFSLQPKFMANIEDLKGVINGISSAKGSHTQVQLEGRVDKFGSAKIKGELDLYDPKRSADINMVFRNVEMTSLTPYSGKFAGRRIKSGKLSMDLKYQIKENKLEGNNQIIVENLVLGERVESPDAVNLPLDLAIALIQDSNGRIDIGLPVSGDLNEPKFSFGHLIGKALANLITKAVTAPFRAIGNLPGLGGQEIKSVDFEAGKTMLSPPEMEKVKKLADALQARPQLKLVIQPGYSPEADGLELKALNVRRSVAARLGIRLAEGEDPGPLDFGNPTVQGAVEALFKEKFGSKVLEEVRRSVEEGTTTSTQKLESQKDEQTRKKRTGVFSKIVRGLNLEKLVWPEQAKKEAASLVAELYARLIEKESLADDVLVELAVKRGRAIAEELGKTGGITAERVEIRPPEPLPEGAAPSAGLSLDALS